MFTGDIVEYHSACYCGDGHFDDWGDTLDMIRGSIRRRSHPDAAMRWSAARWSMPRSRAPATS
jgi:hypothetical protein